MARSWYIFIGGDEPLNPDKYMRLTAGKPICLCGHNICVIYATGTNHVPDAPLSPNLIGYITNALATGQLQPQLPSLSKKYVYLRDY